MIRILVFILILTSLPDFFGLHICYGQDAELFNEELYQLEEPGPYYYFFAGAGYGSGKKNNLFTRTFIDTMGSIEGINFWVMEGIYFNTLARNSTWQSFMHRNPYARVTNINLWKPPLVRSGAKPVNHQKT